MKKIHPPASGKKLRLPRKQKKKLKRANINLRLLKILHTGHPMEILKTFLPHVLPALPIAYHIYKHTRDES